VTAKRLTEGGYIDRSKSLDFNWDGTALKGYQGDTLGSALLANNQMVLARSFKYHRPRGIMAAGVEESGALVTIGKGNRRDPNVKASVQELYSGLEAFGQNAWPNVRRDVGSVNNLLGRFFSAGFYYKTFMGLPPMEWGKGTGLWMQYEKIIRRAAGLGTASREPDPDVYDHAHAFCDLLVVGAGPAGLAAAATAASQGLDVILVEQDSDLGGDLLGQSGADASALRKELIDSVRASGATIMLRTSAFGLYDNGTAGLLERVTDHEPPNTSPHQPRQRFWTVRAKQTILATGALERHIAFGNNDKPGIMTASAARIYLNRYAVLGGEQITVATNNDSAYQVALDLKQAGANVTLLDARNGVDSNLTDAATSAGLELRNGTMPMQASSKGRQSVSSLALATGTPGNWQSGGELDTDLLLTSGGWSPVVNLISHRGVRPVWHAKTACFMAPETNEPVEMAGSAAAIWDTDACVESGQHTANKAAEAIAGQAVSATTDQGDSAGKGWQTPILPVYEVTVPGKKLKCFVDPQHDVTTDDIRLAHQEGFVSVEHLKRYTSRQHYRTCSDGRSPGQGNT